LRPASCSSTARIAFRRTNRKASRPRDCWYLFDEEKAYTWETYGDDGVAVVSTYARLKAAPLLDQVARVVKDAGHAIPVRESALAQYSRFLPF